MSGPSIGIDFGTSFSSMAWLNPRSGEAEILKNAEGEEETPSVVYFGAGEVLVGKPAEHMLEDEDEARRVVQSVKRELVSAPVLALPDRRVSPVEVAAQILRKLARDAEQGHFHEPVRRAVITCPASFDPLQRERIGEAAKLAGFTEVSLLDEPEAAALAYAHAGLKLGQHILVYDLGGGTFDLALVRREKDGGYRLAMETEGIARCGGDDFDRALYLHCDGIAQRELGRAIAAEPGGIDLRFLHECRRRKELLSSRERAEFSSYLSGGVRFRHSIARSEFEVLIGPQIQETIRHTQDLISRAEGRGLPVDTLVLIGGSSRIPLVRRQLEGVSPVEPLSYHHANTAVALGAAYCAKERFDTEPKPSPPLLEPVKAEIRVAHSGPADYRSIAQALQAAPSGAVIRIGPGVYRESLVIQKPVEIRGEGSVADILIEATGSACIWMQADNATVRGLTLRERAGTDGSQDYAVDCAQGRLILEDCDITCSSLACVAIHGAMTDPVIRRCRIHDGQSAGVFVYEEGQGLIENCDIHANALAGVEILTRAHPTLRNCHIHDGQSGGVLVHDRGRGLIEDCDIHANALAGVQIRDEAHPTVRNCRVQRNGYEAIWIYKGARATVEGCDLRNNVHGPWDIEGSGEVVRFNNRE